MLRYLSLLLFLSVAYGQQEFRFSIQVDIRQSSSGYEYEYTLRQVDLGKAMYGQLEAFSLIFPKRDCLDKAIAITDWSIDDKISRYEPILAQDIHELRLRPSYQLTPDGDGTYLGDRAHKLLLKSECAPVEGYWLAKGSNSYDFAEIKLPCDCPSSAEAEPTKDSQQSKIRVTRSEIVVETDTLIRVKLETTLSSETARVGDEFKAATVDELVADSHKILPAGTPVQGRITFVTPAEKGNKPGKLAIAFEKLVLPSGRTIPIVAEIRPIDRQIDSEGRITSKAGKRVAIFIGSGAATGAAIGAIVGGSKAAGIGAAIGAGAGALGSMLTKGPEAKLPKGTLLGLYLSRPLKIPNAGYIRR